MVQPDYREHVQRVRFRRALWGYRPDDVRRHLNTVAGWFSLAGIDELLDERTRELTAEAERRAAAAENEAARLVADARREAEGIREAARAEAQTLLEQARRETARERDGWSRVGRPVGTRFNAR